MKNNKKKIAVLSIMTVLLVVSAVLNVWLNTKLAKRQETLTTNTNEPNVQKFPLVKGNHPSGTYRLS